MGRRSTQGLDYEPYSTWLGSLRRRWATRKRTFGKPDYPGAPAGRRCPQVRPRTGKVAKNVALDIKRDEDLPEQNERERRYLTHAELLLLAKAADRFETLTLVLGYCGLRFGEAVALRRRHVGDRELTLRASATAVTGQGIVESTTKTKRTRQVPVPEPVWKRLKAELPGDPDALVFPAARADSCRSVSIAGRSTRRAAVGIDGLVPHGLRHTTASLAISRALTSRSCSGFWGTPPPR